MKRNTIMAIMITFCFTATLFMIIPIRSAINPYNPWLDYDENGAVGLTDLVNLANSYGTTGDPTKNVNVMNWPVATPQTVFYDQTTTGPGGEYNASGFGHIHLTWHVTGLTAAEMVTFNLYARINSGSGYEQFIVQKLNVTEANSDDATSFPVPSEMFSFSVLFAVGTVANADLAFYLTYA
jgi:hypothetical protein